MTKDWIQKAANLIFHGGDHGEHHNASPEAIAEVIEKHCPNTTINEELIAGMCDYREGFIQCLLTKGHVERRGTPHTDAEGVAIGAPIVRKEARAEEFMECDACVAKPGSPVLCVACQHNRALIAHVTAMLAQYVAKPPSLLQCTDCKNTESPAGAMARQWNHGRCMHCGGYFKVIRA